MDYNSAEKAFANQHYSDKRMFETVTPPVSTVREVGTGGPPKNDEPRAHEPGHRIPPIR